MGSELKTQAPRISLIRPAREEQSTFSNSYKPLWVFIFFFIVVSSNLHLTRTVPGVRHWSFPLSVFPHTHPYPMA